MSEEESEGSKTLVKDTDESFLDQVGEYVYRVTARVNKLNLIAGIVGAAMFLLRHIWWIEQEWTVPGKSFNLLLNHVDIITGVATVVVYFVVPPMFYFRTTIKSQGQYKWWNGAWVLTSFILGIVRWVWAFVVFGFYMFQMFWCLTQTNYFLSPAPCGNVFWPNLASSITLLIDLVSSGAVIIWVGITLVHRVTPTGFSKFERIFAGHLSHEEFLDLATSNKVNLGKGVENVAMDFCEGGGKRKKKKKYSEDLELMENQVDING